MGKKNLILLSSLCLLSVTAGCQSAYEAAFERNEGVTSFAGDAHAVNRANQTEDPWARHSHDTHIHSDGQRIGAAVRRYKQNEIVTDTGIEAPTTQE